MGDCGLPFHRVPIYVTDREGGNFGVADAQGPFSSARCLLKKDNSTLAPCKQDRTKGHNLLRAYG